MKKIFFILVFLVLFVATSWSQMTIFTGYWPFVDSLVSNMETSYEEIPIFGYNNTWDTTHVYLFIEKVGNENFPCAYICCAEKKHLQSVLDLIRKKGPTLVKMQFFERTKNCPDRETWEHWWEER